MATTTHTIPTQDLNGNTNEHANFGTTQDHDDNYLADKAGGLSLAEEGQADYDHGLANGNHDTNFKGPYEEEAPAGYTGGNAVLGDAIGRDSQDYAQSDAQTTQTRPSMSNRVSRSYTGAQIPIVTTYEQEPENASVRKQKRSTSRASNYTNDQGVGRNQSRAASVRDGRDGEPLSDPRELDSGGPHGLIYDEKTGNYVHRHQLGSRAPSRQSIRTDARPQSVKAQSVRAPSIRQADGPVSIPRSASRAGSINQDRERPQSRIGNAIGAGVGAGGGAAAVGEIVSHDRQRSLQQQERPRSRVSLHDDVNDHDRSSAGNRAMSPNRPQSSFGHRPQPNLMTVAEDGRESRYDGRDSRAGVLGRSGTVLSRANTQGRNGTLSRAANGGTVGSRRGAFGRGAGASIGTQPEEVLGRDDIHARAELSERILDEATLRRLSTMEKKDAKRLAKVIKAEGKSESKAVSGSIKELERIVKLQKEAASAERKSQLRLTKWTAKEHKARLRFLKEKERYEKIEGELRNAENDYEERRDHAGGLTSQVAEKTQELDDLRGQKAADDREREVKLLALKNPAHS